MAENLQQGNETLSLEKVRRGENAGEEHTEDVPEQISSGKHDTIKYNLFQSLLNYNKYIMRTFQNLKRPLQSNNFTL